MRRILVCAIAAAFLAGLCNVEVVRAQAVAAAAPAQATTQLPRTVRPTHYDVAIVPDAANLRFKGTVTVVIDVLQPTNSITLNAIDMTISKVGLSPVAGNTTYAAPGVKVDAATQTATFTFDKTIAPGSYRLTMAYTGKIGTQANGLFAIDYDSDGARQRALYTQFENSDARRLIPSWDEPAFKTTFDLTATVPSAQMAVSNMPIAQRTDIGNGLAQVRFATTPKMSTYLLFFSVGDFDRATAQVGPTEVGVVARKGSLSQAAFALESSQAILREYNDYFGTPYPLPKLDNIASPGTSEFFGAMENWGAIFTFEHDMLLDPTISTQADKQGVFDTEAHEMAHQWFGDLVTMQWWDDLWLNEGFASWMQSRTTAKLHPEWNSTLSAVGVREGAMDRDAVVTTHPVVQHVETVEQANQAFDSITYSKGEAAIRMLEAYVGADAWRDGVRRYMKKHAYGNTVTDDLWHEMDVSPGEATAAKPIADIAHQFTLQPGVPMVRVEQATCAGGNTTLTLTQEEFTKDRPGKQPLAWRVPVIAQVVGAPASARTLVANGHGTVVVPGCGAVIVNAGQSGYYRTLYAPAQIGAIKRSFAKLSPIDQLGVMNDSWALGMAGLQPASDYLDLAQATPADADPQIWGDIADSFTAIDAYYDGDLPRQRQFRSFAIARLAPVFARIGWIARPGESDPLTNLRSQMIAALSELGDPVVIAEARRRYAAQGSDPGAVPAALRKIVFRVVARHADAATWDQLHAAAMAEKSPLIKEQFYRMLSSTEDEALASRALDLALTDEPGATTSAGMIGEVAQLHPALAFDFATTHLALVDAKVDTTSRSRYYPQLANRSLDRAMIDKVKAFAEAHIAATSRRDADTVAVNIAYRIKIRNERLPAVDAWLAANAH